MFEPPDRKMFRPSEQPGPPPQQRGPFAPGGSGMYGPPAPPPGANMSMHGQPGPGGNGNHPPYAQPPGPRYTRPLNPGAVPVAPFVPQQGRPPYPGNGVQTPPPWSNNNGSGMNFPPAGPNGSGMNFPPAGPNMSGMNWQNQRGPGFPNTPTPQSKQGKHKEKNIFKRARNRYNRLSKRGKVLCVILVIAILLPSLAGLFEVVNGIILYTQVEGGLSHVRAISTLFQGGTKGDYSKYFDVNKLQQAQTEMNAAHSSFAALSDELDHDGSIALAGSLLPNQLTALRNVGHIAVDGTAAGQAAIKTAIAIAPTLGPALKKSSNPNQPYLDQNSYNQVIDLITTITPLVHDMNNYAQGISLTGLPLSASQSQMVTSILPLLPVLDNALTLVPTYKDALGWLLGVGHQNSFLLEPMDSAELRATGGFTGQFGELTFAGGHMGPISLKNIGKYEEDHTNEGSPPDPVIYPRVIGVTAPDPYAAWWPVGNFGMRDANVSADFPESAKIIMDRYNYEFQRNVSGVIIFTPGLIKQVLHVTGPITIPQYNETITEQNLEDKLHYYQLDNKGIRKEEIIEHVNDNQVARKLFTQRVTKQLMDTAFHLPVDKLLPMANQMLQSMKTKDLQVYFDNTQLENLIGKYGSKVTMDRSTTHDGVYVVQENLSASKASQYVSTAVQDNVTLDTAGNATHAMTVTLDYQKKGDVYGANTYRDYVRIYVPTTGTLVTGTGNGFSQTQSGAYCSDGTPCQSDVYGDGSLVCTGPVVVGASTGYNGNGIATDPSNVLNPIGPPTNMTSDEDGRAMFGGWVTIPPNCTMKVTLSWTVPAMSQQGYSVLYQAQAGIATKLNLKVTSPSCSSGNMQYANTLNGQDMSFNVQKCTLASKPSSE